MIDSRQFPPRSRTLLPFRGFPPYQLMGEFDEIYGKHAAAVFRYALRCVGRRDVAEDIASEVFLALYRNMAVVDTTQLPAWLFAVAKNKAADYWRRADVEQRYLESLPPSEGAWEPSLETLAARLRGPQARASSLPDPSLCPRHDS